MENVFAILGASSTRAKCDCGTFLRCFCQREKRAPFFPVCREPHADSQGSYHSTGIHQRYTKCPVLGTVCMPFALSRCSLKRLMRDDFRCLPFAATWRRERASRAVTAAGLAECRLGRRAPTSSLSHRLGTACLSFFLRSVFTAPLSVLYSPAYRF